MYIFLKSDMGFCSRICIDFLKIAIVVVLSFILHASLNKKSTKLIKSHEVTLLATSLAQRLVLPVLNRQEEIWRRNCTLTLFSP